jgi:uncharacterized membrane protein (DUF2068 family)
MSNDKVGVGILSVYKLSINLARIILGSLILFFGCSYTNFIWFLAEKKVIQSNYLISSLMKIIDFPSQKLACFLAISLILFSLIELVFVFALMLKRKWGALGMFILAIIWTFLEILFVSKFLVTSKITGLIINAIIMIYLYKLITKSDYFKK